MNIALSKKPFFWIVITAAFFVTLFKIYIALTTYGSNDIWSWNFFANTMHQYGAIKLYQKIDRFIHPPFMIHILNLWLILSKKTSLPFQFWVRLPGILADFGSILLVKSILEKTNTPFSKIAFMTMVLAPISIMVSGFHGNTDPVLMFFLLIAIDRLSLELSNFNLIAAGLAFGMAISIKMVPLMYLPAIFFYLPDNKKRIKFLLYAFATFFTLALPYLAEDPKLILVKILNYHSLYGYWGISFIFKATHNIYLNTIFKEFGAYFTMLLITLAAFCMNWRIHGKKPSIFTQCALTTFLFFIFTPGFGVQYLAWTVPWIVLLSARESLYYNAITGLFLFTVYSFWSEKFPWYYANSVKIGLWHGNISAIGLLAWLSMIMVTILLITRIRRRI